MVLPNVLPSSTRRGGGRCRCSPGTSLRLAAASIAIAAACAVFFLNSNNDPYERDRTAALRGIDVAPGIAGGGLASGRWNSSRCAVVGLAMGYGLDVYERFVGSLRATGYDGAIILGLSKDGATDERISSYLDRMGVTTKVVDASNEYCTHFKKPKKKGEGKDAHGMACAREHPDYKIQWGRFPLSADWIRDCESCTDGVMLTDARDAHFQSDPFEYANGDPTKGTPGTVAPIMMFEEIYPKVTTEHWLTDGPVKKCRGVSLGRRPMLCSGSTMGTREGVLRYVDIMAREFDHWMASERCRSEMIGDDQSMHNFLYYAGAFDPPPGGTRWGAPSHADGGVAPIGKEEEEKKKEFHHVWDDADGRLRAVSGYAASVPHRTGPIHVVGVEGNEIFRERITEIEKRLDMKDKYEAEGWVNGHLMNDGIEDDYDEGGDDWRNWLDPKYSSRTKLTDSRTGEFLNLDGRPSPQVHQEDRLGLGYYRFWLNQLVKEWRNVAFDKRTSHGT